MYVVTIIRKVSTDRVRTAHSGTSSGHLDRLLLFTLRYAAVGFKKNLYLSLQLRSGSIIEKDLPVEASRSKQAAVGAVANSLREPGVVLWNIMFVQNKYLDCNIRARVLDRLFVDQTISRFFFNSTVESLRCAHKRSDQSLYALYSHRRSLFNVG